MPEPLTSPLLRLLGAGTSGAISVEELGQVVEEARPHGLAGVVYELVASDAARLRGEALLALRDEALSASASTLRARVQLQQTLVGLGRAGIVPLAMKGPLLAARCWPYPWARPCTDIDLFVPPSQMQGARDALCQMGLRPLSPELEGFALRTHHHLSFRGASSLVELHFRLNSGLGRGLTLEMVEPRIVEGTFAGHDIRQLGIEDELIYLSVHAAGHLFERLSWLLDLRYLLDGAVPGWDAVIQTAKVAGVSTAVWLALSLARGALDARVPSAVLEGLAPAPMQARALLALFPPDSLVDHPLWRQRWRAPFARLLLVDSTLTAVSLLGEGASRRLLRELGVRFPRWSPPHWRELF